MSGNPRWSGRLADPLRSSLAFTHDLRYESAIFSGFWAYGSGSLRRAKVLLMRLFLICLVLLCGRCPSRRNLTRSIRVNDLVRSNSFHPKSGPRPLNRSRLGHSAACLLLVNCVPQERPEPCESGPQSLLRPSAVPASFRARWMVYCGLP